MRAGSCAQRGPSILATPAHWDVSEASSSETGRAAKPVIVVGYFERMSSSEWVGE